MEEEHVYPTRSINLEEGKLQKDERIFQNLLCKQMLPLDKM